jgi:OmpA-OmpF porin, OOP family
MSGRTICVLWASVLAAASGPACASEKATWFVGAAAGQSRVGDYQLERYADRLDDTSTSWRVFGGWRADRHFALGAGYVDLGSVTSSGAEFGGFKDRVEATAFELLGYGIWPLSERFEVYAVAGYVYWDQDVRTTVVGDTTRGSASDDSYSLGLGANAWVSERFGLQLEWRRYAEIGDLAETGRENRWDVATLGVVLRFGK